MTSLRKIKWQIKNRLGNLWWYTAVFFVVQRCGDAINAFIGLWLVPKYVPQEDPGAVLPLAQVGKVLAFPLSILAIVFTKYLNIFAPWVPAASVAAVTPVACRLSFIIGVMFFVSALLPGIMFLTVLTRHRKHSGGVDPAASAG